MDAPAKKVKETAEKEERQDAGLMGMEAFQIVTATMPHFACSAQAKKLRQWMQKHQDERLSDGAKAKLFSTVQAYFKAGQASEEIREHTQVHTTRSIPCLFSLGNRQPTSSLSSISTRNWC